MTALRWDPNVVRLVAQAIATQDGWSDFDEIAYETQADYRRSAGAALDVLDDAGLLATPSTSDGPRTWPLPEEPGAEVKGVRAA